MSRPEVWPDEFAGEFAHGHASRPDVQQGEELYRQALTLTKAPDMRPPQAHCHRGLGTLYAKTGRREQARSFNRYRFHCPAHSAVPHRNLCGRGRRPR